jgi:hypothetical protein
MFALGSAGFELKLVSFIKLARKYACGSKPLTWALSISVSRVRPDCCRGHAAVVQKYAEGIQQ